MSRSRANPDARQRVLLLIAVTAVGAACAQSPAPAPPSPAPTSAPTAPADTVAALPAFRTTPPALGPVKPLTLPAVVSRDLPNGLRLLVVEHHELPLVDMILVVRTGGEANPRGKIGVASLTAALLDEGTRTRNALAISDQQALLGVTLSTDSDWDRSLVTLHAPTATLDSALALFADVALNPSFPTQDLERLRKEQLTELLQLKDRGPEIADRAYASILYGDDHPYGRPLSGTETSMRAITRADVRRFHDNFYRPNNATLIVVGDVTADDIERRATALFGRWVRRPVAEPQVANVNVPRTTTIHLIDKPGAAQSSVRVGTIGVARATEDYFPILVMNTILGGSFTSRLNQNLRETKGYTYGARSRFDMRRAAGPFTASAEIVTAKTDSAVLEFMKELRSIRDTVPSAELEKAKRFLQLQLPADFESTGDIASQLLPIALYSLPLDYFNRYVQRIEEVRQSDVQRVAEKYVDPAKLSVVIVGDRTTIEAGLRATQVGETELRDFSGQPIRP